MNKSPRIAFFGSPALAAACLAEIIKSSSVGMVVTQPDKAAGRGRALTVTPVALIAEREGVPLYKPPSVKADFTDILKFHGTELIVVVAYGKLLPREIIDFPPLGSINLHASLLPKYRGASPIQAALLNGERNTGITVQKMRVEMDAGDVIASRGIAIGPEWTAEHLTAKIAEAAPAFLRGTLESYLSGTATPVPQREEEATFCSIIRKDDGLVDWREDSERIRNRIRAFNVWPVCHTRLGGKTLRLFDALAAGPLRSAGVPGEVLAVDKREGILVQTGRGVIALLELQLENKKRMGHRDFANGFRDLEGHILGSSEPAAPGS